MRTPATIAAPGSSVDGFGVTWWLAGDPRRTEERRVPLPVAFVAFVALATLGVDLGLLPTVNRERRADIKTP
jgi:hypothetical protein